MKSRFTLILYDRDCNGQIMGRFNDINSIDQVVPSLVKNWKIFKDQKGFKDSQYDTVSERVIIP